MSLASSAQSKTVLAPSVSAQVFVTAGVGTVVQQVSESQSPVQSIVSGLATIS